HGPRRRARSARAGDAPQAGPQPLGGAGHPPAHRHPRLRHRGGAGGPRAAALRGGSRLGDDRSDPPRQPLRPARAGGRCGRKDGGGARPCQRTGTGPSPARAERRAAGVSGFSEFWAGRELWREPMLGGVLAAALLSYLGVFVVLKRMVFVSAALSEISSVGVAFAFYVGAVAGIDPHAHGAIPLLLEPT